MTTQSFAYWPKVLHPNKVLPQMTSDTLEPRFFFGASQVPVSLEGMVGGSIQKYKHPEEYESSPALAKKLKEKGDRIPFTSIEKHNKILLPKNFKK